MITYESLRTNGFISLNKHLIRVVGLDKTMFICHLIELYQYYEERGMLEEDGFFIRYDDWGFDTGQTRYCFTQCVQWAEKEGIIKTHMHGIPAKKWYYIQHAYMKCFIERSFRTKTPRPEKCHPTTTKNVVDTSSDDGQSYEDYIAEKQSEAQKPSNSASNTNLCEMETLVKETRDTKTIEPPSPLKGGVVEPSQIYNTSSVEQKESSVEPTKSSCEVEKPKSRQVELVQSDCGTVKSAPTTAPQTMQNPVKELAPRKRQDILAAMSTEQREQLDQATMDVLDYYKDYVKPDDQTRSRGKERIRDRLLDGWTVPTLKLAAERYVLSADQDYRVSLDAELNDEIRAESKYLYGVGNFYGRDAYFLTYLDEEVDWDRRTMTPLQLRTYQEAQVYKELASQYKQVYGDKWFIELHRPLKTWSEIWQDNLSYFSHKPDFKELVYGDRDIPEDPDLCPGLKIYGRDWDETDPVCQGCASKGECEHFGKHELMEKRVVIDNLRTKRLFKKEKK